MELRQSHAIDETSYPDTRNGDDGFTFTDDMLWYIFASLASGSGILIIILLALCCRRCCTGNNGQVVVQQNPMSMGSLGNIGNTTYIQPGTQTHLGMMQKNPSVISNIRIVR
jgi:hypothetical protein